VVADARAGYFGVERAGAATRAHRSARAAPVGVDRFAGLDRELGPRGVPLLTDALATLECEILAEYSAGDHWIVVGRVDALRTSPLKDPLTFFAGAFGALR
jgi:flavin reductase (DIM6/NTAB) family NADH-FMN oxidoreductase RutF